jgi:demethylmenaquinone methyltransferase/2-methoxy-6-polyprenyl-1,4-benzoquinol methylase
MAPYTLTPRNLQIRDNFDAIAPRYDLTNRVISLGIDRRWRRVAARRLREVPVGGVVLDLACGTCDMALEVLRQRRAARVVGADLSRTMLALARKKIERAGAGPGARSGSRGRVDLVGAPAEALPFKDGAFDAVTIAFGIRNVPDHRAGLREMARVLRPGGIACILEFSTPPSRFLWRIYNYYFFNVLPRIGGLLTGREAAYRYLTDSVSRFPGADGLAADMDASGFADVSYVSMNGGVVCVHSGVKA